MQHQPVCEEGSVPVGCIFASRSATSCAACSIEPSCGAGDLVDGAHEEDGGGAQSSLAGLGTATRARMWPCDLQVCSRGGGEGAASNRTTADEGDHGQG